jgi:hypothetical protein
MATRKATPKNGERTVSALIQLHKAAFPLVVIALGFAIKTEIWHAKHEATPHLTASDLAQTRREIEDLNRRVSVIESNRFTTRDVQPLEDRILSKAAAGCLEFHEDIRELKERVRALEKR